MRRAKVYNKLLFSRLAPSRYQVKSPRPPIV